MAAGFLITRILLVFLLSELNLSSAFPIDRGSLYPRAWQGVRETQQGGHGNRRPLHFIQALRQPHRKLQADIYDQVQVRSWQNPPERSLIGHSHAQIQNQPSLYHQTQSPYQPWSDDAIKWTKQMSPPQPLPQVDPPFSKPVNFEFNLKIPFANFPGRKKETSSTTKGSESGRSVGAGPHSQLYRPSSVQIHSSFNSPSDLVGFSDKGSSNDPNRGKNAHDVSKPSVQLSLAIPIPPPTEAPKPATSNGGYLSNLQGQGSAGFVQNSYMEPANPQSSSTQSGSDRMFLNSAHVVQQQREHQTYDSIPATSTDDKLSTFSPGHTSQYLSPTDQVIQGKIPTEYPLLQSENVYSDYYSAQINPTNNYYETGQTVSSDPTSQYEQVQSDYYSAGHVKPNVNNYEQCQTLQPAGAQQDALPYYPAGFDPWSNFHSPSADIQSQMSLPRQHASTGELGGKPNYMKLLIDVDDEMDGADGQHNYFTGPPTHYGGY